MNMGRRLSAVCLLMLASSSAMAMTFTVPLNMDGQELGMLPVSLSGMDVEAVSESELKAILGHRVTEKIWQVLAEEKQIGNDGMVPLKALEAQGITLTFDASTLTMAAKISTKAFGQANVDFGEGFVPFVPTESSEFSWLNSLNFSHQESWQDSSNASYTSFDWLAQFNIGGATGVNLDAANYLEISDGDAQVLRGEWTAFYDNPNAPYRFSLGDVESGVSGYLSNISMGGLSIESDYAELQPQRMVGPGNNQELILQESAEVEIEVNGQVIFSGRQEAGRFNLMNLPMVNGANDITVHVTYLSGKQETFVFTQFYNSNLLDKGMVNYAFTAGVPSVFADKGIDYTNTWAMTGFVEYGVSSSLTVGANGLAAKYGNLLGGLATVGTDWGNLSSRLSFSEYDHGDVGNILSFGFESAVIGASESQTPNLRLSAEFASDYITSPWEAEALPVSYDRYLANYMWSITEQWSATVSASYFDDDSDDAQTSTTSMLNWKNGDVTVGAGMTYTDSKAPETDETQYFLTLDWRWNHKKYGYSLGASYNTLANQSRVDISRANSDRVGGVGYRAMLEHDDNRDRENALLSYTANRVRLEGEVERSELKSSSSGASYSASLRGNTAIGYANGKFGWGRAQAGPFVVTQVHPTLSGHEAHFGVAQDGSYKAAATSEIGGLLPLDVPYAVNSFNVSVPDAPLGYDWGQSQFSIAPGAATGHSLMVGSDASYTAMGVLLDSDGKPISYLQGELSNGKLHTPFFTNKGGRFYVQGVGPGTYTLTVSGKGFEPVSVVIEKTDKRLIELGTLHVKREEENRVENP